MNDIEDDGFVTVYESAGAPRGRVMGNSRVEGAEKVEGRPAGRTGRSSDLPWRIFCGFVFLALFAYALPDQRAWCKEEPPVTIGDRP